MRKLVTDYGAEDIFKFYCKKTGNPKKLTQTQFSNITKQFFSKIIDCLIFKGIEFNLPYKLGNIRIRKSKINIKLDKSGNVDKRRMAPDWKATKELWKNIYPGKTLKELKSVPNKKMVYHLNRHTDGYVHKWHWDKTTCIVRNSSGYSLEMVRSADRKLAKALKDEDITLDYSIY